MTRCVYQGEIDSPAVRLYTYMVFSLPQSQRWPQQKSIVLDNVHELASNPFFKSIMLIHDLM